MTADVDQLKEQARAVWSLGDYSGIAGLTWPAAEATVAACAVSAGQAVLDVGAGTGNAAVAAARAGARVVASDLTPALVEKGRARTAAEGLDVEWHVADAEALPFTDASFDCVVSVFGAMFAPRPDVVARELFRVVRPGGTVGMTAWTSEGYQGLSFAISARYLPPEAGVHRALEWGREDFVRERFGPLAESLRFERGTARWSWRSAEEMSDFFARHAGPEIAMRQALEPELHAAMAAEKRALAEEHNRATDGSVLLEPEYLIAVARRP